MPTKVSEAARFTGKLILRSEEGYEEARIARIYHARHPERYPAAVLVAATERDVVEGVRLAMERGWKIAVRSGGHSFPVWSLRDDTLLIDLGRLKGLAYDAATGIASASPAIQGGHELNSFLADRGRFFATGGSPSVGIGGFLLQGGLGWNFRRWGFSAGQIAAMDIVTAEGELVRADENTNSDLFWAARGAGPGFFGVVTRFHLRTRPLPRSLSSTIQTYSVERYAEVLEWLHQEQHRIPDSVHLVAIAQIPPFPVTGDSEEPVFAVWGVAFCDTAEESQAALRTLEACPVLGDALMTIPPQPTTLEREYAFAQSGHPEGFRYQVDSCWVTGSGAEIAAASRKLVHERPPEDGGYTFFWFNRSEPSVDMAASLMTELMVGSYTIYDDAASDDAYRDWALSAMAELNPLTVGQYWGYSDQQRRQVKVLADDAWSRLQEIRAQRDPDGVFSDYLAGRAGFRNRNSWEDVVCEAGPAGFEPAT
jgi:FAD/FMN-containing dehydrogenase